MTARDLHMEVLMSRSPWRGESDWLEILETHGAVSSE